MIRVIEGEQTALKALKSYLSERQLAMNERLPPERQLCLEIGLSRARLRKALALLEAEGLIWRHVGAAPSSAPSR